MGDGPANRWEEEQEWRDSLLPSLPDSYYENQQEGYETLAEERIKGSKHVSSVCGGCVAFFEHGRFYLMHPAYPHEIEEISSVIASMLLDEDALEWVQAEWRKRA